MQQVFSPKQVARAIGASESSVKRWCDRGILPSIKTAGGHRRLPISGILEFLRAEDRAILDPLAIGLPEGAGATPKSAEAAAGPFQFALVEGNYNVCRRLIFDTLLAGESIARIFDELISPAMVGVGEDWCQGNLEVFQERRGCEIVSRLVHELRLTVVAPKADAPLSMGGSIEGDPYMLPNRMIETTLIAAGWKASSLGGGVPLPSLSTAIASHRPRLFWLSVSIIGDDDKFQTGFAKLQEACGEHTSLVVGGRALTEQLRKKLNYTVYCENLQRLDSFVRALYANKED